MISSVAEMTRGIWSCDIEAHHRLKQKLQDERQKNGQNDIGGDIGCGESREDDQNPKERRVWVFRQKKFVARR